MKKHGFTLIELIVVIAIVGVLAAILIPAMLGYVRRSKITTANTASKEIFNALNTATVELTELNVRPELWNGASVNTVETTGPAVYAQRNRGVSLSSNPTSAEVQEVLFGKVSQYFSDVSKVDHISYRMGEEGCLGVGVVNKNYPGSYPIAVTVDIYNSYAGNWQSDTALGLAVCDTSLFPDADEYSDG